MSETYSTDELVEEITVAFEARIESIDDGYTKSGDERLIKMAPTVKELTQRIKLIIIARLRAADALCAAAKEAWPQMFWHNWNNECRRLYEAIAEYGGREKK